MTTISKNGIKITDEEAIRAYVSEVNGRATSHTTNTWDVVNTAKLAEKALDQAGVAKTRRVGAEFIYITPPPSAKSYRRAAICSLVRYRRYPEGWRVMKVEKTTRFPGTGTVTNLCLPASEIERITQAAVRQALQGIVPLPAKAA